MRGGLFTVDGGDAWAAVIKMMECAGASLSVISFGSLYGFILLLTIPEVSECAKFKDEQGKHVYKIVLKIVLLDDNKNKVALPLFMDTTIRKSTMTTPNFSNEALKQERVFKEYISTEEAPVKKRCADMSIEEASVKKQRVDMSIEEAPFKKRRADMSIKPITLGVACNELFDKTNYETAFLRLLSQVNGDNIVKDVNSVIEYIRTSMKSVTGLRVGVIVMNYSGNYITDTTNYQMITLSKALKVSLVDLVGYKANITNKKQEIDDYSILDSNLNYAKYKCIEYSIAQMLILLLVFKSINTDAHKSNFLTIFYKKVPSVPCLENITTWMIDMGRLVDVENISNIFNYNYGEYSSQFNKYYGKKQFDTFYEHMCNLVLTTNILTLFDYSPTKEEEILLALHNFTTFITVIDCIVNKHTHKIPKCAFVIEYLVASNNINSMIHVFHATYADGVKEKQKNLLAKYKRILQYMRFIITKSAKYPDVDYSDTFYINMNRYNSLAFSDTL
jgi:hypothetical protein